VLIEKALAKAFPCHWFTVREDGQKNGAFFLQILAVRESFLYVPSFLSRET